MERTHCGDGTDCKRGGRCPPPGAVREDRCQRRLVDGMEPVACGAFTGRSREWRGGMWRGTGDVPFGGRAVLGRVAWGRIGASCISSCTKWVAGGDVGHADDGAVTCEGGHEGVGSAEVRRSVVHPHRVRGWGPRAVRRRCDLHVGSQGRSTQFWRCMRASASPRCTPMRRQRGCWRRGLR